MSKHGGHRRNIKMLGQFQCALWTGMPIKFTQIALLLTAVAARNGSVPKICTARELCGHDEGRPAFSPNIVALFIFLNCAWILDARYNGLCCRCDDGFQSTLEICTNAQSFFIYILTELVILSESFFFWFGDVVCEGNDSSRVSRLCCDCTNNWSVHISFGDIELMTATWCQLKWKIK